MLDERCPVVAGAGDDVDDARRKVGLLADLGERSAVSGVVSAGLSTTGVAGGQRRRDLPRRISSGKFHGMTWPATPSGGAGPNPAYSSLSAQPA